MDAMQKDLLFYNIFCSRSAFVVFNVKVDSFTLGECFKPGHIYCRMVNKHIVTIVLFDKTKTLFVAKPFNSSLCQNLTLLKSTFDPYESCSENDQIQPLPQAII